MLHPIVVLILALYNYFEHSSKAGGVDGVKLEACRSANHTAMKTPHHSVMLTLFVICHILLHWLFTVEWQTFLILSFFFIWMNKSVLSNDIMPVSQCHSTEKGKTYITHN